MMMIEFRYYYNIAWFIYSPSAFLPVIFWWIEISFIVVIEFFLLKWWNVKYPRFNKVIIIVSENRESSIANGDQKHIDAVNVHFIRQIEPFVLQFGDPLIDFSPHFYNIN